MNVGSNDYALWQLLWNILQASILAVIGVYTWVATRTGVNTKRIKHLEDDIHGRLDAHSVRLARMEEGQKRALRSKDLVRIQTRLDETAALSSRMVGELNGVKRTLELIQEKLLSVDRK